MLKKVLTGTGIAVVLAIVFLLGSLFVGTVSAQPQGNTDATQTAVQSVDEAAVEGPDLDTVEEQVGDQSELDDDTDEAAVKGPDLDNVENQVEQDGEFDGEF